MRSSDSMGQQVASGGCGCNPRPHIYQVKTGAPMGQHRVRDGHNAHFSILTNGQSNLPVSFNTQA